MLKSVFYLLAVISLIQPTFNISHAETVVNVRFSGYPRELISLALEKTVDSHGAFKLNHIKADMNIKRASYELYLDKKPNFIIVLTGDQQIFEQYAYAPFPIDLGLFGYRFPLHHEDNIETFSNITALEQIAKYRIIQGSGWFGTKILKENGFTHVSEASRASLRKMILTKRADLLFSTITRLKKEAKGGVVVNKNFGLFYSVPRFFVAHKKNKATMERIYAGLVLAFNDGSLDKLINKYYFKRTSKDELTNRHFITLENTGMKGIDERYFQWKDKLSQHFTGAK
jgi:hypothetical protein